MPNDASIDFLRDVFLRNKEEIFLIDVGTGNEFTYGDVERHSLRLAAFLSKKLGIAKGDRVAFILPNSIEGSLLYFACMQMGAAIVPINQRLQSEEIDVLLKEAEAKTLITAPYLLKEKKFSAKTKIVTISITFTADSKARLHGDVPADYDIWKETEENPPYADRSFDGIADDDSLALIYTSGTTNRPKGVPVKFGRIIRNGRMFAKLFSLPRGLRFLGTFSQGYLGGLYNTLLFQFFSEGSVALDAGFSADVALRFWSTVKKFKVDALWPVPAMLSILMSIDLGHEGEEYASKNLKFVFTGTAPLPAALKTSFEKRYGIRLWENYALSETFFISTDRPSLKEHKGVGTIVPGCTIQIIDDEGKPCPAGTPGEIVVVSEYMTDGYFNNLKETQEHFRDGKFYTGDAGYVDADGYLFMTDRKKDIIIRGGINISPKEIEDVIAATPGVREVAVVGLPHPVSGEEVVAAVVGDKGLDVEAVKNGCSKHLALFKVPSRVYIVSMLPKSPTGKIQKQKVRELLTGLAQSAES